MCCDWLREAGVVGYQSSDITTAHRPEAMPNAPDAPRYLLLRGSTSGNITWASFEVLRILRPNSGPGMPSRVRLFNVLRNLRRLAVFRERCRPQMPVKQDTV